MPGVALAHGFFWRQQPAPTVTAFGNLTLRKRTDELTLEERSDELTLRDRTDQLTLEDDDGR